MQGLPATTAGAARFRRLCTTRFHGSISRARHARVDAVYVVHATKALIDKVGLTDPAAVVESTSLLGPWYATIAKGRPQLALFVNEATLLPVLMPLAPSRSLNRRFPEALARVLATHGVDQAVIDAELEAMEYDVTRKTSSRSMAGMLVEFTFLARHALDQTPNIDLTELSVELASTP